MRRHDVTERALVENRLADSERQHRELIERLPLAAFVRRDRRLVFANQAAADLVGLEEPDDLLDMTLDSLFTPDGLDVLEERIARRIAGEPVDPIVRHGAAPSPATSAPSTSTPPPSSSTARCARSRWSTT